MGIISLKLQLSLPSFPGFSFPQHFFSYIWKPSTAYQGGCEESFLLQILFWQRKDLHKPFKKRKVCKPEKCFEHFSSANFICAILPDFAVLPCIGLNSLAQKGISIPLKQVNSNLDQCFELPLTSKSTVILTHLHVLNRKLRRKKDLCLLCTAMVLKNISIQKKISSTYLDTTSRHWKIDCSHSGHWFVMPASPADRTSDPAQMPRETHRCEALYQCILAPSLLFLL